MPAVSTSILVGSIELAAQSFTANGFACTIPAGTYYLRHATGSLSLLDVFGSEVENETGVSLNGVTVKRRCHLGHRHSVARPAGAHGEPGLSDLAHGLVDLAALVVAWLSRHPEHDPWRLRLPRRSQNAVQGR
jgi:hypothetical protein